MKGCLVEEAVLPSGAITSPGGFIDVVDDIIQGLDLKCRVHVLLKEFQVGEFEVWPLLRDMRRCQS